MKQLGKIKDLPLEIAVKLSQNARLQQLLVDDTNQYIPEDISDDETNLLDIDQLFKDEYISFSPVVDNNITNTTRNTFLIINLDEIDFVSGEDNMNVSGAIFIGTDKQHAVLHNNKLRLIEMIDEVLKSLHDEKLSVAGQIKLDYATFVSYSNYIFGYKIIFQIVEQDTKKAMI